LPDLYFSGDLRHRSFTGQRLAGAVFAEADLYRARFAGADLTGAVFTDCFAAEADFAHAQGMDWMARKCNFYGANFRGAVLAGSLFWHCVLATADLRGADLRRLTLTLDCNSFEGAQLSHGASAELALLFSRAQSPYRGPWRELVGGDLVRLERFFAR
jgi:uncharacterized protein YjbI with pentapeptide repeats